MAFQTRFVRDPSSGICCDPESDLCKQEFKEETDINGIVTSYLRTGSVPGSRAFTARYPQFGDFSGVRDLSEALRLADSSKEAFMTLPVSVRERFGNRIENLDAFLRDENNRAEAEKLGLVEIRQRPESDQPPMRKDIDQIQPVAGAAGEVKTE